MQVDRKEIYEFGGFRLDVDERVVERLDGVPTTALPDKTFETLVALLRRRGSLVTKDELLQQVWPDTIVEENNLGKRVHVLRQFLGEAENGKGFIETVRGYGYRFVGVVKVVEVSGSGLPETLRSTEEETLPNLSGTAGKNGSGGNIPLPPSELVVDEASAATPRASKRNLLILCAALLIITTGFFGYLGLVQRDPLSRSLAILPAAPINTAERNDLFDIGIADSLINNLASADELTVRPLSTVKEYAGSNIDPIEVGRQHRVDYVLAANYQISGGRIKVTSQLFDVAKGRIQETFQSQQDVSDVFAAQDAIAADFGNKLMTLFGVSRNHPVRGRGTANEEAYRAYVQGMYLLDTRNKVALEYLEKAVSLDPAYAQAWAGKALAHDQEAISRYDENYSKALEAIKIALARDPNQSDAYSALCRGRLYFEWDPASAEEACLRAIELNRTSTIARQKYAAFLGATGRGDEAISQIKIAEDLEPISYVNQVYFANTLYLNRRFEEAVVQYKALIDLKPDRIPPYNWFIRALEAQGNKKEAFDWFIKSLIIERKDEEFVQRFRAVYEQSGYDGVLVERIKTLERDNPFRKAGLYARIGDKDNAFEMLEKCYQQRAWQVAVLLHVEPQLDSLRDDPRYHDLLRRVKESKGTL